MRNYRAAGNQCDLCYRTSHQQRLLLSHINSKIRKFINSHTLTQDHYHIQDQECQGFARLVRAIKASQPPKSRYHPHCLHLKWARLIKKSIGCSLQQLDYICHDIANKVSERNYHLYLLETQIKNAAQTAEMMNLEKHASIKEEQMAIEERGEKIDEVKGVEELQREWKEERVLGTWHSLKDINLSKMKVRSESSNLQINNPE